VAIGANSYGATTDIGGLVPKWSGAGSTFSTSTRPTLAQVELYCNQISSLLNAMLAEAGFTIPVTQADAKLALDFFVDQEVAAIAEGINGSGRFGPTNKSANAKGRFALLVADAEDFIKSNMAGFERLGAARSYSATAGLAFRDTDNRGKDVHPMFSREQYKHQGGAGGGPSNDFIDWDPIG
jgi:hypothetical protein